MRSRLQPWLVVAALTAALLAGMHAHAEINVTKPDFGPSWQIRAQVQLMFPK